MINVLDRVVQNPHRYQLVPVSGQEGVYDLVAIPGTVTEGGTAINRSLFNTLQQDIPQASYLAFCMNVNSNMLDAAFGKGNEDRIEGIGRQLAMYAWFKGDSKVTYPFTNLRNAINFNECVGNVDSFYEVSKNNTLLALIDLSPYAKAIMATHLAGSVGAKYLAKVCGLNSSVYSTVDSVLTEIKNTASAFAVITTDPLAMRIVETNVNAVSILTTSNLVVTLTNYLAGDVYAEMTPKKSLVLKHKNQYSASGNITIRSGISSGVAKDVSLSGFVSDAYKDINLFAKPVQIFIQNPMGASTRTTQVIYCE